jgi:hypothetical protein
MRKELTILPLVFLTSCGLPQSSSNPSMDVTSYMSDREREVVNNITFEVQKVLDTIDDFRNSKALDFVTKLSIPGWKVEKKEEKILFLTRKKFIAYKDFTLPTSCIKNVGGAKVNVCHMKLSVNLSRLGEAFGCDVKSYSVHLDSLKERVKIVCSY